MRIHKINLLTKLLISYLLVLMFPVIVILCYYYPYSADVVKEKEMDWNAHITEQFMTSMDTFTRYVYNLPFELVQNREFKMYKAEESDYQRVIIANEMKKYNATDAFIYNTLLYVKNIGYLFSKTGSAYSTEDLSIPGVGYYYENWEHQDMIQTLNDLKAPVVRPVENVVVPGNNRVRMLTFVQPLPVGGTHSPGAVMIMVKEDTIVRMMKSVSEIYSGDFFVFDGQGRRLVSSNETSYQSSDDFRALVQGIGEERSPTSGIYAISGSDYLVSHSVSDKNGWKYVSLLPVSQSLKGIRTIQLNTVVLVGLILLLEVFIIYVSIRKNYQPIRRLVDLAVHVFEPQERRPMNEIDTIKYTLEELSQANSKLDEHVKGSLPIMRDNLLFELVSGHYADWEEWEQEAGRIGIRFKYEHFTVAVVCCESDAGATEKILACCRKYEELLPDGVQTFFFKSIYQHELILASSHESDFPLESCLESMQESLLKHNGLRTVIGIGKPVRARSPVDIHVSYLQALRTAEFLRIRKTGSVLIFDDMEIPQSGAVSYFAEILQSLELSILKNDAVMLASLSERMIGYLSNDSLPPHMIRSVYLNTVTVIFNGLQRFRHDDQSLLRLTDAAFKHRYTLEQMIGIIRESCSKLCDMISETLPLARPATQEAILSIIAEKGMDPNCSLQMMADYFDMSVSNFSHHFKKTMGQNFKEYIDQLRIQKSIQLLRDSEETLEAISQQVGYTSTSSFIRSFKKMVGTTPGQYRNTHKA
ncbi:helix-turn-helix domain-containing protein [Paenibacillus glucanolyticus]|uniref:helix-turn-helix domain-containing protein n=1 Tax=Paenibacillus glucanolyticus TaxID=59843 RepID=UPI00096E42E8|nr:helix-turn-helix domain-containing protein [Paenibacillus glucanolyticus]MPY16787.1 AraC family transcriptional regulator [Paenibacillus glucanolyticus]OMF71344.1 AraC family transcriptional regulator [Paenibacillus glucanolyticus]